MAHPRVDQTRIPITELVWPLLVENLLRTSLMSVDTLMLSRYSETAVAAMSLVSQMAFFILLIYMMISVGASILIAQNLGAGRTREAEAISVASLVLMLCASLVISILAYASAAPIIGWFGVEASVARYATQFMRVYGGLSTFMAINIAQASLMRVWGYPRAPMWVNVGCLLLTATGNALCLFGWFGFPIMGMVGVAASTVFGQAVACGVYHWLIRHKTRIHLPMREARTLPKSVYRSMLRIGVPTVGENLSYNVSQIATLAMIARIGTRSLAAYGILISLLRYVFIPGVSIGSGAQLKVGYLVGAGRHNEATRRIYRYFAVGFCISLVLICSMAVGQRSIFGLFTREASLLSLVGSVIVVAIVHEPARNFNTIIIPALKGAGDVLFPVYVGVASMWGLGVLGSWLLGLKFGLGLVGVWIAMALDEWVRGLTMLFRWRSGNWKTFGLVRPGETPPSSAAERTPSIPSPALFPIAEE